MSDRIKKAAQEEFAAVEKMTVDSVKSGAYLYPIKGIFYYLSHRDLWKPLLKRLAPTLTLGVGVTTLCFLTLYVPQAAILFFTSGPIAAISTILLVLSESSTITMVLAKALLIEDSIIDTFDGTLLAKGESALVARERTVKGRGGAGDAIARLGKLAGKPFAKFTPSAVIRYLMYLPLNFIPIVGTVLFVVLQGRRYGPGAHARYFQLKGLSGGAKEKYVEERQAAYTAFGVPAVLLEMVPIAGIFFAFTNTCGAALWAADMEKANLSSPELKKRAEEATEGN